MRGRQDRPTVPNSPLGLIYRYFSKLRVYKYKVCDHHYLGIITNTKIVIGG